jgi:hypothetical protein
MFRRLLALLLVAALSLGWTAVSANACTGAAGATAEKAAGNCGGCGDGGTTSDCSAPDCTAPCAHAPIGPAHVVIASIFSPALLAAETPRAEFVLVRSIPPDIPPPR